MILLLVAAGLYPSYQRWQQSAPQRLLAKATELESLGQISSAEESYLQLAEKYVGSAEAAEALFRRAKLQQYDQHDVRRALLTYLQLEKDYPHSQFLLAAREESAHIVKFALRDYPQAIVFYQRLIDLGQGPLDRYLYELGDCYFRLENYTQARIEFETLIEDYPHSALVADALFRKGGLLVLENRNSEARQIWEQLIELYPESSYRPQTEFNLAKLLEEEDRLVDALEKYRQLTDFPRPAMLQEKIDHLEKRIAAKKKAI